MRCKGEWGGHLEITAMAEILQRDFVIYSDEKDFKTNIVGPMDEYRQVVNKEPLHLYRTNDNRYEPIMKKALVVASGTGKQSNK